MANVKKYTDQIAKAQKGRDVRDAIVNAINAVSDENNEYNQVKTDILEAQTDITEKVAKNEHTEQKFVADVKKAETLKQGLDSNIEQGTALKSQLETTISTADTGKKNLDASNTTAAETKADLDASNATASETKTGLDATNKTAAGLVTSLGDKIAEGTQVKTDIQTTGETAMSNLQAEAAKQQEYIKTSIDDTLSVSGKAADAAVTGKKIDSLKEDISTKITKFYASSQGETHLADSDNGKIMDMMLYGKSEQKQYSGKNLFDFHQLKPKNPNITTVTTTEDAIIVSSNAQTFTGAVKIYEECDAFKGKTITISANIVKADNFDAIINFGCGLFYENAWHWKLQKVTDLGARYITVIVPETITKIQFLLNTNDTNVAKANTITVSEYMVEYGSEPTTYEPYTGGIPSPNPDYPQEIKSVVNPTMKVCGKNLFNYKETTITNSLDVAGIEFVENGFRIYTKKDMKYCSSMTYLDFSKLRIGETYTLSANLLIVKGVSRLTIRNRVNTIIAGSSNITESGTYKISFTLTDQMCYVSFFTTFDTDVSGDVIVTNIQLEKNATPTAYEPYHEQTITLPYTLNAIPVSSGGNVTINGQQYIADYVDVERGKLVRMCKEYVITGSERLEMYWLGNASYLRNVCCINNFENIVLYDGINPLAMSDMFIDKISENADDERAIYLMLRGSGDKTLAIKFLDSDGITTVDLAKQWLIEHKPKIVFVLSTPEEIDLTSEEVQAFKALATYYPITNISINSEQLDGYTVLNYPISMENGWNYVKQQIGDTRDYIYDMDARTQDTDLQVAEAYVNSEYAVVLTELEV